MRTKLSLRAVQARPQRGRPQVKITLFRPPKAERQKLSSTSMCWYLLFLGDPRPLVHVGFNIIGRSSVFTAGASVGINCFGNHTAKVISIEIHV